MQFITRGFEGKKKLEMSKSLIKVVNFAEPKRAKELNQRVNGTDHVLSGNNL